MPYFYLLRPGPQTSFRLYTLWSSPLTVSHNFNCVQMDTWRLRTVQGCLGQNIIDMIWKCIWKTSRGSQTWQATEAPCSLCVWCILTVYSCLFLEDLLPDNDHDVCSPQHVAWLCSLTWFRTIPVFSANQTLTCTRGNKIALLNKALTQFLSKFLKSRPFYLPNVFTGFTDSSDNWCFCL